MRAFIKHWTAMFVLGAAFMLTASVSRGGSIFDDDFKPSPDAPAKPAPKAPEEPPQVPRLPPAEEPKPTPTPAPEPTPTPHPDTPAAPVETRLPVPAPTDIAKAEKLVKQVFAAEYKLHTPEAKAKLARALLNETRQSQQDPQTLYVLFREARDLAAAGGDAESALEAVRGLRDWFLTGDKAAADMEHTALMAAATSICSAAHANPPRPEVRADVIVLMDLAERDLGAGDYASAAQAAAEAVQVSHKGNDSSVAERVSERATVLQNVFVEYGKAKDAIAALRANPNDPSANTAAGKFYAFSAGRLDIGMGCLAKGNDPALKALAAKEVANPADAPNETALADAWVASMKATPVGNVRDAMRRRAIYWYDVVASQSTGLTQLSLGRRSDDLRVMNLKHGMLGEYFRGDDFAARVFARVDPKIEFNWNGQQPDGYLPAAHFSVRWTGFIKAAVPGTYQLIVAHDDGARIWLDGKLILDKWGGNCGREALPVEFTGALQSLKVDYEQLEGNSYFGVGWVPPGTKSVRAIPVDALYHDDRPAAPVLDIIVSPGKDGGIALTGGCATQHNAADAWFGIDKGLGLDVAWIDHWNSIATWPSWEFTAPRGDYDVAITYTVPGDTAGSEYVVHAGSSRLVGRTEDTGGWYNYKTAPLGRIHLVSGGHTLRLNLTKYQGYAVMNLVEITLTPVLGAGR